MNLSYLDNHKSIFRKYTRLVTWFARTQLGRDYLGIPNDYKDIKLLLPNGYHRWDGGKTRQAIFSADNYIEKKLYRALHTIEQYKVWFDSISQIKEAFLYGLNLRGLGSLPQEAIRIRFNQTTFTPDANGTGQVRYTVANTTPWSTVIATANGNAADPTTDPYMDNNNASGNFVCARGYTPFDTSSLTTSATITAGSNTISAYFTSGSGTDNYSISVFSSTQASNTTLAVGDYSLVGSTQFITAVAVSTLTLNARNTFTLNSSGDSNISKTGWSKFSWRQSGDYGNSAPSSGVNNVCQFQRSTNAPQLIVTFTLPASASGLNLSNFSGFVEF